MPVKAAAATTVRSSCVAQLASPVSNGDVPCTSCRRRSARLAASGQPATTPGAPQAGGKAAPAGLRQPDKRPDTPGESSARACWSLCKLLRCQGPKLLRVHCTHCPPPSEGIHCIQCHHVLHYSAQHATTPVCNHATSLAALLTMPACLLPSQVSPAREHSRAAAAAAQHPAQQHPTTALATRGSCWPRCMRATATCACTAATRRYTPLAR